MQLPAPRDQRLPRPITLDQLDALLPDDEPQPEPCDFCLADGHIMDDDELPDAA